MHFVQGVHFLTFAVESYQTHDEDDNIENKRHVHVDVDHGADNATPPYTEAPGFICIIVNPEGYSEEEDEVGEDEVEYGNGDDGCRAGLHDVRH